MKVLVVHGPNLNKLEKRSEVHYGKMSQHDLFNHLAQTYQDIDFTFYQSNAEGDLIEIIQNADLYDALLINAGAYTHTSIAIRDALDLLSILKVEVHLSNINAREPFRKTDYIYDVCDARFMGKQIKSYEEAINFIIEKLKNKS